VNQNRIAGAERWCNQECGKQERFHNSQLSVICQCIAALAARLACTRAIAALASLK
jgi:hypothetical protein